MKRPIDLETYRRGLHRRAFLGQSAYGLGGLALAGLLGPDARAADSTDKSGRIKGMVEPLHFPAKAKRVIHLCMAGGPSQFESFDPKPELKRLDGKPFPDSFTKGQQLAQLQGSGSGNVASIPQFIRADFASAIEVVLYGMAVLMGVAALVALRGLSRGVQPERYAGLGQDDKGINRAGGPYIAWFKDPAGNVLAVLQER